MAGAFQSDAFQNDAFATSEEPSSSPPSPVNELVKINGTQVIVEKDSLNIEKYLEERSVASFNVIDRDGTGEYVRGMPVEIYDNKAWLQNCATRTTVTAIGTASPSMDQKVFGAVSCLLDGDSDYLSVEDSDDWAFGTGDFTIDMWVRFAKLPLGGTYCRVYSQLDAMNAVELIVYRPVSGNSKLRFGIVSGGLSKILLNGTWNFVADTWYHIEIDRSGSNWYLFAGVAGVTNTLLTSDTASFSSPNVNAPLLIGCADQGSPYVPMYFFNGYIDEVRVSKGIARHTAVFVPPTQAYDSDSYTKLLLHFDSVPLFGGFIDTPERIRLSPSGGLLHSITCMDYTYLADKRLVVNSYQDKTAGYIVDDIFDEYLAPEGITIGEIQAGPTVTEAIINYVKVSEAYDAIKELSGTFTWFISESKQLYFIDRDTYSAPWNLDDVNHRVIKGSPRLSEGNSLYRNFQYIWGGTDITSLQTSDFVGDGNNKIFVLGYPLSAVPTVTDNSVSKTVGIKGIDTGKDYYWTKGDSAIYAQVAPSVGHAIQVQYYGQYPLIAASINSDAIVARRAIEGGTGIVEDIAREAFHESRESSRQSAQAKLTQYCQDAEKFRYQTYDGGLSPGQLQLVTYSPFGFSAYEMLIESVKITADGDLILYDVSCVTGPLMGTWSKFFNRLLTRQDQSIRIGGDLLMKLLPYNEDPILDFSETPALSSDDFSSGIVNHWLPISAGQTGKHNVEHERMDMAEAPSLTSHTTKNYKWDDGTKWGFGTWK